MSERWREVAENLETQVSGPTEEQSVVAQALGIAIPPGTPAPVAAVILRERLASALGEKLRRDVEVPHALERLEAELGPESCHWCGAELTVLR